MTILELPNRSNGAKRPTVATPVLNKDQLCKSLEEIDENIDLLFCVKGTICGSTEVPNEAIEALNIIHNRLRRLTDALFMAM